MSDTKHGAQNKKTDRWRNVGHVGSEGMLQPDKSSSRPALYSPLRSERDAR